MRKKLIVLPGNLTSPFFVNEIPYLISTFDEVKFISFSKENEEAKRIQEEYSFRGYFIEKRNIRINTLFSLLAWMCRREVRSEIASAVTISVVGAKKLAYILYYGLFYLLAKKIIDKEIKGYEGQVYLYAYWLSRSAYCVANYERKGKIVKKFSRGHGYDLYTERNKLNYLPFRKYISENLDEIYFISEDGREYFDKLRKNLGAKSGCALNVSRLGTFNDNRMKKEIHQKPHLTVASCSSIIGVKRLDLIIKVMAELQQKGLSVQWFHIGDGALRDEMQALAGKLLADDSYQFMGKVDNKEILNIYIEKDADFFINMSDSEGIPVSIMEAMSVGIPVIARDVGGNGEIVGEEFGLLLGRDSSSWGEKVFEFASLRLVPEKYCKLSSGAVRRWEAQYSAEKNYRAFVEDVVEERNGKD